MSQRFTVTYLDGRSLPVISDSPANAQRHAEVLEAERVARAKQAGIDLSAVGVKDVAPAPKR